MISHLNNNNQCLVIGTMIFNVLVIGRIAVTVWLLEQQQSVYGHWNNNNWCLVIETMVVSILDPGCISISVCLLEQQ